ncbi:hypothetical protein C8R42DRAFT_119930 [Lentinula raphanica]|nr:hypothetical protein C8R42DRAFT_119930 [Lentinula raphanica]
MLLSSISAYLILGLLSAVHAAPTPPGTPVNHPSNLPMVESLDDWQMVDPIIRSVMYGGTGSGHVEKVSGPFTKRVNVNGHEPHPGERLFTAKQAGVPPQVVDLIEHKFKQIKFEYSDFAPLRFSTKWPDEERDFLLTLGYYGDKGVKASNSLCTSLSFISAQVETDSYEFVYQPGANSKICRKR